VSALGLSLLMRAIGAFVVNIQVLQLQVYGSE
jgi:hypothetical protein